MRRAKRITLLAIGLSVLALLALGAVPQYLGGGETYHVTATEIGEGDRPAVDASGLDDRRYPYLTEALETGRSEGYETGPVGIKSWFTHTPFNERGAIAERNPDAVENGTIYVDRGGTLYRVEITEEP